MIGNRSGNKQSSNNKRIYTIINTLFTSAKKHEKIKNTIKKQWEFLFKNIFDRFKTK